MMTSDNETGRGVLGLLFLACATFVFPPYARASALVIVFEGGKVVVGVDSKTTWIQGKGPSENTGSLTTCKIIQEGKYFITWTGVSLDENTGFDVRKISREALRSPGELTEKVAVFDKNNTDFIVDEVKIVARRNPQSVRPGLNLVFIGSEASGPVVISRSYFPKEGGVVLPFGRTLKDGQNLSDVPDWTTRRINELDFTVLRIGPIQYIREILQLAIKDPAGSVGPPLAILEIGSAWPPRWIEQGACQDIE